jgi:hypothetical protein
LGQSAFAQLKFDWMFLNNHEWGKWVRFYLFLAEDWMFLTNKKWKNGYPCPNK